MNITRFYVYHKHEDFFDPNYIFLVTLSLIIAIALKRQFRKYCRIMILAKFFVLIMATIIAHLVLRTNIFKLKMSPNRKLPLKLTSSLYFPVYLLKIFYDTHGKTSLKHILVIVLFCLLLFSNGVVIGYMLSCFYEVPNMFHLILIGATLTTTQPDAMIQFLSLNERYEKVINYLKGEVIFSLLLIFPVAENVLHHKITSEIDFGTTVWFFAFGHFVSIGFGWFVAQLMTMLLRNLFLTLDTIMAIVFGGLLFVYIASGVISISSFTTAIVYCIVMRSESHTYLEPFQERFGLLLGIAYRILDSAVCFYAVTQGLIHAVDTSHTDKYFYCFVVILGLRAFSVIIINLIFMRYKSFDMLHLFLNSVVCPTSTFSLIFVTEIYFESPVIGRIAFAHAVFNTFASNIIHNFLGINLLKWTNIGRISDAGVENMEKTLTTVKAFRDNLVRHCKLDSRMAQVNWNIVNKYATLELRYPYPEFRKPIDWENKVRGYPVEAPDVCCEACPLIATGTPVRVFQSMVIDQTTLVLSKVKATVKRMMYDCYISEEAEEAIISAINNYEADLIKSPLVVIHNMLKPRRFMKFFKVLSRLLYSDRSNPVRPRRGFYRIFARMQANIIYQIFNHLLTIGVLLPVVIKMIIHNSSKHHLVYLYAVGFLFFIFDMFVNIFAMTSLHISQGAKLYFKSFWYIMEFISIFGAFAHFLIHAYRPWRYNSVLHIVKYLKYARAIRLIHFITRMIPNFFFSMEFGTELRRMTAYQCALALDAAISETMMNIPRWRNEIRWNVLDAVQRKFDGFREELQEIIMRMEAELPDATSSYKTNMILSAGRSNMYSTLVKLKSEGTINPDGFNYLKKMIAKDGLRKHHSVPPTNATLLFFNNYWIGMSSDAADLLRTKAILQEWPSGHTLVQVGKKVAGVYLLIAGHLRIHTTKRRRQPRTPNRPCYQEFETNIISPGNSFGEIELLTGERYRYTLTCEGKCRVYFMPRHTIHEAILLTNHPIDGIDSILWKRKMMNLAVQLMLRQTYYEFTDVWKLKLEIQRAFVPDVRCYKIFPYVDSISDILLIQGCAMNFNNGDTYNAPKYIPRSAKKLILQKAQIRQVSGVSYNLSTKLMIVPVRDMNADEVLMLVEAAGVMHPGHQEATCPYHVTSRKRKSSTVDPRAKFDAATFQMPEEDSVSLLETDNEYERRLKEKMDTARNAPRMF